MSLNLDAEMENWYFMFSDGTRVDVFENEEEADDEETEAETEYKIEEEEEQEFEELELFEDYPFDFSCLYEDHTFNSFQDSPILSLSGLEEDLERLTLLNRRKMRRVKSDGELLLILH